MLKRLFIAVFVIGLVVGLNGTANCDVNKGTAIPYTPNIADPGHAAAAIPAGPEQPTFHKPNTAWLPIHAQLPALKQDYFCDVQDYTSGTIDWGWTIPDAYGDDLFNMRFTSDANYDCTLMVAHLLFAAEPQVGAPTVRVYLWDDDGFGFPGNKLDSVDVLLPGDGLQGQAGVAYWIDADFTTSPGATANGEPWVFSDGQEYHIGWTQLDQGSSVMAILSDDANGPYAGEERASESWNGAWGTMLNDWGGDVSFYILAERCCAEIPFTDCYTASYIQNIAVFYRVPQPAYGDSEFATRFDVFGPETLVSVDVGIYDPGDGSFGDNDVYVTVYDDDGGIPGAQLAQVTMPAGTYPAFPSLASATMPAGLVVSSDYHIGISTDGVQAVGWENLLASDGSDADLRTSVYADTTNFDGTGLFGWVNETDVGYADRQLYIEANLCKDQYSDCSWNACYTGLGFIWRLPDAYDDYIHAQKFTGIGEECRVQEVNLLLYWSRNDIGLPHYTANSQVKVFADAGGYPGAELASITVTPAEYGIAPPPDANTSSSAWLSVDFTPLDVMVTGAYWVGIQSDAATQDEGITVVSDAGGGSCINSYAEYWGTWGYINDDWNLGADIPEVAMVIEAHHCCIPYSERACLTPFEWSTPLGDQARDGASFVEMSDSWCDLTLNWHFEHPDYGVTFTGPVVYDDKVICAFGVEYRVFDLTTGTQLYTYAPSTPFAADDIRSAPTVTMIAGYPDPVFFAVGGTTQEVTMVNLNTGAEVWSRNVGTVGVSGLYGNTRYNVFTVLNLGGTDYVFWATEDGTVVGVDALTGMTLAPGFPVNLGMNTWVSGATDGSQLFYNTGSTAPQLDGDVIAIDAATGTINWQLSATDGLQGATAWVDAGGTFVFETFTGGCSYDAQRNYVYANSFTSAGDYPADGMFYRINATSGALAGPATVADRCSHATPVIDANRVYMNGFTRWASPPAGGDVYAINKGTGLVDWAIPGGPDAYPYDMGGVLSCEPLGVADQLFTFSYSGYMSCLNAETGDEVWRRRVDHDGATRRGQLGALALDSNGDSHLLFANTFGDLVDLTKQADRPRLEFQTYQVSPPVEFGPALSLIVTVPNVFANTGCADLNITSVAIDEDDFGPGIPNFSSSNVDNQTFDRAAKIADAITDGDLSMKLGIMNQSGSDVQMDGMSVRDNSNERTVDHTAAGFPTFMNGIVHPVAGDVIAPGDTADLVMDVIQANINRGPQSFYLQLGTDDPDFFLNDPAKLPQMLVTIVGGCLVDTTTLDFGPGAANFQLVANTGRLANGDWGDGASGANGFYIGGVGAEYYQGSYVWAVSTHRIATSSQAWSGQGEAQSFISMQPDPNWCDNDCKPYLDAGVTLGYSSPDGLTYTPITGDMVCKSFLDSVQNFTSGGVWNWEAWGAPFDNDSTMGLYAVSKTVGTVDPPTEVASLGNLTLELLDITERNGRDVPGWFMGEFWDCDLGNDHVAIDRSISTAWVYNDADPTYVWGQIKVPFGCGAEPIINTFETWGNSNTEHGFWDWYQWWDTCYAMLSSPPGAYYFVPDGDEEAEVTFAGHDFAPNETYKIGIAHFALFNMTDASVSDEFADMSRLVNKWAGFGRGDVNNDGAINLADIIYLAGTVNGGPGAVPFQHLSDVNADGAIDGLDVDYLIDYYFNCGPCPVGDFAF